MALYDLEALVLCGSVLSDGLALELRRATKVEAIERAPEVIPATRYPQGRLWPNPVMPDGKDVGQAPGAGRPLDLRQACRTTRPAHTTAATATRWSAFARGAKQPVRGLPAGTAVWAGHGTAFGS
jgi:hypothetical protein